jgi:hypothetical protein
MNDLRQYLFECCTGANYHHLSAGDHYISRLHFAYRQGAFHNGFRVFIDDLIFRQRAGVGPQDQRACRAYLSPSESDGQAKSGRRYRYFLSRECSFDVECLKRCRDLEWLNHPVFQFQALP